MCGKLTTEARLRMSARKQTQSYDQEEERISEGVGSLDIYTLSIIFYFQGPGTDAGYER